MKKIFIIVSGNLGVGKTSLVERLADGLKYQVMQEPVEDNPYLKDFYIDMNLWSYHLQMYFLGQRAKQHLDITKMDRSFIMDRSVYECGDVFAPALYHLGKINERDYQVYKQVYSVITHSLCRPDLLIYLEAPIDVMLKRIANRGLGFDYQGIDRKYISTVDMFYKDWIRAFNFCPIVKIDSAQMDFVNDQSALEEIIATIKLNYIDK